MWTLKLPSVIPSRSFNSRNVSNSFAARSDIIINRPFSWMTRSSFSKGDTSSIGLAEVAERRDSGKGRVLDGRHCRAVNQVDHSEREAHRPGVVRGRSEERGDTGAHERQTEQPNNARREEPH